MRKLLVGLFLLLGLASAQAQNSGWPPPAGAQAMLCVYNLVQPTVTNTQTPFAQCDANGNLRIAGTVTATLGELGKTTTEAKVTVAVTNTYQQALASSVSRTGCTVQYIAVAGTKGYVFFGSAPADTTTSFQLTNGQSVNCAIGGIAVATDAVQVTGTGTDIFIVSNQ